MHRRNAAPEQQQQPDGGNDDLSHEERGQHGCTGGGARLRPIGRGGAPSDESATRPSKSPTGSAASRRSRTSVTGGGTVVSLAVVVAGAAALLLLVSVLFLTLRSSPDDQLRTATAWWSVLIITLSVPVLMAVYVAVQGRHANERVVASAFVVSILSNQLPRSVTALGAALAAAAFGVATRPAGAAAARGASLGKRHSNGDDGGGGGDGAKGGSTAGTTTAGGVSGIPLKTRAVLSCFFMVAVLLHENFMIWVVSATYEPSHSPPYPDALQDNGRIALTKFVTATSLSTRDVQNLRDMFNIQWALVSSAVAGALVGCELKLGRAAHRNMWAVGMRALLTLGIARFVRTVSFLLTVLPSQMPSCYRSHYPYPVPDNWVDWIKVGLKPAARGGCNDLIISGHSTVTTVLACVGTSVADNPLFSLALWSLLAFDYFIEVYQGFHYSVDMWMGAVVTSLIFRSVAFVEPNMDEESHEVEEFMPLGEATVRDLAVYAAPALLAFMVIIFSEEAIANVWIVLYCAAAAVAQVRGEQHYMRHILICNLYIGLIVYL